MNIDLENIFDKCILYKDKIKNKSLKECCGKILIDYKDKLIKKPGTTTSHHYFEGGLLYHTYCVTRNAITILELYPNLNVDSDLVIFGALLHDIGKTKNYTDWDNKSEYKYNGSQLLGHSYEGTHIVENYLSEYDLNEEFKNQALHMIGSHMTEFSDCGTLVLPKMLEVIIIHFADKIDSTLEPAHNVINQVGKGEKYKTCNGPRDYYKSLNPEYRDF